MADTNASNRLKIDVPVQVKTSTCLCALEFVCAFDAGLNVKPGDLGPD